MRLVEHDQVEMVCLVAALIRCDKCVRSAVAHLNVPHDQSDVLTFLPQVKLAIRINGSFRTEPLDVSSRMSVDIKF